MNPSTLEWVGSRSILLDLCGIGHKSNQRLSNQIESPWLVLQIHDLDLPSPMNALFMAESSNNDCGISVRQEKRLSICR
jgi:hypothetical protein